MGTLDLNIAAMASRSTSRSSALTVERKPLAEPVTSSLDVLSQGTFLELLNWERKRSERSRKPFALMIAEFQESVPNGIVAKVLEVIACATRETDITGWYSEGDTLGTIFTEVGSLDAETMTKLRDRVSAAASAQLSPAQCEHVEFTFYRVPDEWNNHKPGKGTTVRLYPEVAEREDSRRFSLAMKRFMDVAGSMMALMIAAPVFFLIALAIKFTSKGPVFFRQERVGQHGVPFPCLKFRTMLVENDSKIHREYVEKLIRGEVSDEASKSGVFKIKNDPRITAVGGFLRKLSLDELPQFINVLKGEMSLVGPRPPIQYELEAYDLWHRRRVFEAKPGVTGLWQVRGRSRTTFDEMVRLDLQYARSWSLWLDVKILLETPRAVISGSGAH